MSVSYLNRMLKNRKRYPFSKEGLRWKCMKAILLGVGADSENSTILSPVFSKENNKFVFLPIGDNENGIEIDGGTKVLGEKIINYLGTDYTGWLHIDPYFDGEKKIYTYGDRTHNKNFKPINPKSNILLDLKPEDYLVFCCRMYEMERGDYKICKRNEIEKR